MKTNQYVHLLTWPQVIFPFSKQTNCFKCFSEFLENQELSDEKCSFSARYNLTEIYAELSANGEEPDLLSVLTVLASTVIPGLPPGGGIQSK